MDRHGFVWPSGLPECAMCGRGANDPVHINPTPMRTRGMPINVWASEDNAAAPTRPHSYTPRTQAILRNVRCVACGYGMDSADHTVGLSAGVRIMPQRAHEAVEAIETLETLEDLPTPERAFVATANDRLFVATPARSFDVLPREISKVFQERADQSPHNLWIGGRFVEADRPNRNQAFWSSDDLEVGAPTVASGPLNWLHDERHIVGAIADARLVEGNGQVNRHIAAVAAVWPWVWPAEARLIQKASDSNALWYSMECQSREVACLDDGCDHTQPYADYMKKPGERCPHVIAGGPRRFVDPFFMGGAVILPPVRPGWGAADARVMAQATELIEQQEAAFEGMSEDDAAMVATQVLAFAEIDD